MLKDKFHALIEKESGKSSKKKIENIVVFIIILIITVIAINTIWNGENKNAKKEHVTQDTTKQLATTQEETTNINTQTTIEQELETILTNIEGVGKVKVLITYSESNEVVAMYNENSKNSQIEEKDSGRRN